MNKKDYICKDCPHNNHGWCKERRIQGLKSITKCSIYDKYIMPDVEEPEVDQIYERIMGEVTNYWKIQNQFMVILNNVEKKDDYDYESAFKDTIKAFNAIGKILNVSMNIHDIKDYDNIDGDIIRNVKAMHTEMVKKYGYL